MGADLEFPVVVLGVVLLVIDVELDLEKPCNCCCCCLTTAGGAFPPVDGTAFVVVVADGGLALLGTIFFLASFCNGFLAVGFVADLGGGLSSSLEYDAIFGLVVCFCDFVAAAIALPLFNDDVFAVSFSGISFDCFVSDIRRGGTDPFLVAVGFVLFSVVAAGLFVLVGS